MNRSERRRQAREAERPSIASGWKQHPGPKQKGGGAGWFGELDRAFSDGEYAVLVRTVQTEWGPVEHAAIRNGPNTDIPWAAKQRIKNELFGKERVAIEVFPTEAELVDHANMYHIWVLPKGFQIPFGID